MNLWENIKIALISLKSNFLRSFLTLLIIIIGITCLVGILTAIDAMLFSMTDSFNRLGANAFSIYPKSDELRGNRNGRRAKAGSVISFEDAIEFKDRYKYGAAKVSASTYGTGSATVKYGSEKTNPTVRVMGIDENYLDVSSYDLAVGRNFTSSEVRSGENKVIIGSDIVKNLFLDDSDKALGKMININTGKYLVIGVLASKGSSLGGSSDRRIFMSLMKAKQLYGHSKKNYSLACSVANATDIENAISSAIGALRNIRKLKVTEENDFTIRKSDGMLSTLKDITSELRWGTIAIALITLLGAAIGLMNIMLVSVTERTKEIGVRKALGATKRNVLIQFLTEAIVVCQIGGIGGIIFGMLIGNVVSLIAGSSFIIPWAWMSLGFIVCVFVGIISGLYPALRAASLDPIESLRYE